MSGFVVIVDFRLEAGARPAFRSLIDANAMASAAREPGCRRFDVVEPQGEPDRVVLYEIYDDAAAFADHCATDHYASFDRDSARLVAAKSVILCDLVCEGSTAGD